MYKCIHYPDTIEPLVQFVEDTSPKDIVEKTVEKLRSGISTQQMCTASGLAALRSSEIPFAPNGQWGHHGGHLHPISGLHAVKEIASRLPGEHGFLPIVQNVALSNKHIHHPSMGPYLLPEFEPFDAGGVEETKQAFFTAVRRGSVNDADHHFLWLAQNLPPAQALDVILTVAIPKNLMDDHKFIYPIYTWRFLQWVDWESFRVLTRGPVRYISQPPSAKPVVAVVELIEKYQLLDTPLRETTGADETEAIIRFRDEMNDTLESLPETTARALADGLSLEGTAEALSLAASELFLRLDTQNPMDVHMHTGANVRRHLMRVKAVSTENKVSALLLWNSGPEVKNAAHRLSTDAQPASAIPEQSRQELLATIREAISANDVEGATARVEKYGQLEYDPQPLITTLGQIACQDNITEMHALKHHQACVEEFTTTREPFRFRHLVSAAKAAAISYGKAQDIYQQAKGVLEI
jgi:hypothetical protein